VKALTAEQHPPVPEVWQPEDRAFWAAGGSRLAWRTLIITTASLVLSFATWFTMSAVVVRLPQIGFRFDTMQLFWLAAMPGLAGGTLRILHTFLIPIFGTRMVIGVSALLKLIPVCRTRARGDGPHDAFLAAHGAGAADRHGRR
jgi:MFS transporter, NNP family, nitrate/nitrite transporter